MKTKTMQLQPFVYTACHFCLRGVMQAESEAAFQLGWKAAMSEVRNWQRDPLDDDGIEDSPCAESADFWGTGEGRSHGIIG